jgi:phosphoribosyl-ATP pyrophosphohydrolase
MIRNVPEGRLIVTFTLHDLEKRVQDRAQASADVSYTRKLLDRGVAQCAKKLGEEAVEAALAAVGEDRHRMIAEAADVLYHLLVVLHARDITLDEVEAELGARTRQSGLDEKAARRSG